jgi:tocopherol cyclase
MWTRIRNIWRPENFHFHHRLRRGGGHFEGWYFKLVDAAGAQPYAIIPGVFLGSDRHAFIQVLDGRAGTATYHRFPIESFEAERDRFAISIAGNRFGREGLRLDIDGKESGSGPSVQGEIRLGPWSRWPVTATSPGVMGPYSFVPFMECNHGILSLDHALDGVLQVGDRRTSFDGGRGYMEKDWGRGFPSGYVWTQSNHFERPGICVTASVARIPWLTGSFRGFLVGFLLDGELHRFTTYTGAEIERLVIDDTHLRLCIRNRTHRLEVEARKADGAVLHAPYERKMIERVAETMTSEVDVRFSEVDGGAEVFAGRGGHACLEAQGDLAAVLDA